MTTTPTFWGDEFLVNTTTAQRQFDPTITGLSNGGFVVVWTDQSQTGGDVLEDAVRGQIYDALGNPVGAEFQVNTMTAGDQNEPTVAALADGGFMVAWIDISQSGDVSGFGIGAQRFDATGARVGTEIQVNTITDDHQSKPSIATLADGGFVVVWRDFSQSGGDISSFAIRAQRFDADGLAAGAEFLVNTTKDDAQQSPAVATLASGAFVVVWQDESATGGDTTWHAIRGQMFNALGAPMGGEFLVNTTTTGYQYAPSLAALANGNFVVTWEDYSATGGDTSSGAVRGQVFDASGSKAGGEFVVNTTITSHQHRPDITALADGGFLAVWSDASQTGGDTSSNAIRAQRFDADGVRVGQEFLVNASTDSVQTSPVLDVLADGRIVVAWTDFSQSGGDTSDGAIRAQILDPREAVIDGTHGNDVIAGRQGDTEVNGHDGNDAITGMSGDDVIDGDAGNDTLDGGAGDDSLSGGSGNDALTGGAGNDTLRGGSGDDILNAGGEDDIVDGGSGADTIIGGSGAGNDAYVGGPDEDTISYASAVQGIGVDLAAGTASGADIDSDTLASIENVIGGAGDDQIAGGSGANMLSGGGGGDELRSLEGDDHLIGGGGNDQLVGGFGGDILDGGDGIDTAHYGSAAAGVIARLNAPDTNTGDAAGDSYTGVENLTGSQHRDNLVGDDAVNTLQGLNGNDVFNGNDGDDTLIGGGGNDRLVGGVGADILNGGDGDDAAHYGSAAAGVTARLNAPGSNTGDAAGDSYVDVENMTGSQHADNLVGNDAANTLRGQNGNDVFNGNGGDDTVIGGNGNDRLTGGVGADILNGGDGIDTAHYGSAAAGVTARLSAPGANTGDAAGDSYVRVENLTGSQRNDNLVGDDTANTIEGLNGNDVLTSLDGDDSLIGGGGNDRLTGGADADILNGGDGVDTANYGSAAAGVTARLYAAGTNTGDAAGDSYTGVENLVGSQHDDTLVGDDAGNNTVEGLNGNDTLVGRGGDDNLFGGQGNDQLFGEAGNDRLTGDAGADRFRFNIESFGQDTIADFEDGVDRIQLTGSGLTFASFTESQNGADTVLSHFDGVANNTITLLNTNAGIIDAADFVV